MCQIKLLSSHSHCICPTGTIKTAYVSAYDILSLVSIFTVSNVSHFNQISFCYSTNLTSIFTSRHMWTKCHWGGNVMILHGCRTLFSYGPLLPFTCYSEQLLSKMSSVSDCKSLSRFPDIDGAQNQSVTLKSTLASSAVRD